ncbi:hypothetical protein AC579_4841, partial [Pseudocercospora musae]
LRANECGLTVARPYGLSRLRSEEKPILTLHRSILWEQFDDEAGTTRARCLRDRAGWDLLKRTSSFVSACRTPSSILSFSPIFTFQTTQV